MNVGVSEAAEILGVSSRQARRYASTGRISNSRIGTQYAVSSRHLLALQRCAHHGRPWSTATRLAALDLLSTQHTKQLTGSERSRLKQRMRQMDVSALTGQILQDTVTLRSYVGSSSVLPSVPIAKFLGLTSTGSLETIVSNEPAAVARIHHLALDDAGKIAVVAGNDEHREVLAALTLYAYGDSRESSAASRWISEQQERL